MDNFRSSYVTHFTRQHSDQSNAQPLQTHWKQVKVMEKMKEYEYPPIPNMHAAKAAKLQYSQTISFDNRS